MPPRAFDADAHVPATSGALPPFDATFERLVGKVGAKATPVQIAALHGDFERRTGAFGPDDPWYESRSRAFWDDTMTRQAEVRDLLGDLEPGERLWADALGRAHRGLFVVQPEPEGDAHATRALLPGIVLSDVLSGAELVLHEVDAASRDALASTDEAGGLFDGTVVAVASPVRLALLPGAIFHPEGAEAAIAAVVLAARARGIPDGALLDALLRMELSLRTLSRVKPAYAYRAEALAV